MPTTTRAPAARSAAISGRKCVVGRSMCVFWYVVSASACASGSPPNTASNTPSGSWMFAFSRNARHDPA